MAIRFNIGLRGQTADLVKAVVDSDRGYTPKDVIYDALTLFDFALQEIAAGRQFGSIDKETGTITAVVTPILQDAQKHPEWLTRYLGKYGSSDDEASGSAA